MEINNYEIRSLRRRGCEFVQNPVQARKEKGFPPG